MTLRLLPRRFVNTLAFLLPSAAAIRDCVLVMLASSMLAPTLSVAGATFGTTHGNLRSAGVNRAVGNKASGAAAPTVSSVKPVETRDSVGTDFWLALPEGKHESQSASLLFTADADAEGTIDAPASGLSSEFAVKAGEVSAVEIPGGQLDAAKGEAGAQGVHVQSSSAISVVVSMRGGEDAHAYLGLPSDTLGTEYIAPGRGGAQASGAASLFVLATSEKTTISIKSPVATGKHATGESFSMVLRTGEVYALRADTGADGSSNNDLTGAVITSDKPVAVFDMYEGTEASDGSARGVRDLMQLPPTETWGRSFVAASTAATLGGATKGGARVRVVASTDDTHVNIDGADVATIGRGQAYEQSIEKSALITSDNPVLVTERADERDTAAGDASISKTVLVEPTEQYLKSYNFASPSDGFERHFLNLVVAGGSFADITLDGYAVAVTEFTNVGDGRFSVARIEVRGGGAHRLSGAIPFAVTAYGAGGVSTYGYPGGMGLNDLTVSPKSGVSVAQATAASSSSATGCGDLVAVVRHAPAFNGRVEGSVQMLSGEGVNLNSGNVITSDLLVPGTPSLQINGTPNYQGTIDGTGSTQPTGYGVTINSGAQLRHLVRRTNPVTMSNVPVPPASTGTRSVTLNSAGQSAGNWATVRDLTLNSGVGPINVPAGTYNNFTANDRSYLVFGVAGATTPSVYNFDALTLNSNSGLRLLGPVIINVGSRATVNSGVVMGYDQNPRWLELNVARFDVTVNSQGTLYGVVRAPSGTVNINGRLRGAVTSDRLTINGGASLEWMGCPAPSNQPPTVSAGANQTISLPNAASLIGTVGDDGLPTGSSVSTTWSKLSGPGTVAFANANAAATTATFGAAGTYVLRLSASDSQLTSTSDVTITVNPANQPPVVSAGPDKTIVLPNAASLSGTATDDGRPSGAALTSTWSVVSGPGGVTFANSHAAATTATFAAPGTYVLRLTASDTQLSASDDVTVTVDPRNLPPIVNAGPDQIIELPNTASLSGSATDDGYPRNSTLTHAWSVVAGPGTVSFASAGNFATTASFGVPGTYTLRLTASDTEFTVTDNVTVTVYPQNQPPTASAGPDQTVSITSGATLSGTVADDGWPYGSTLTASWSLVNGPGAASFANAASPTTTVAFGSPGTYTLRLTANDTRLTTGDDIRITVLPVNQPPAASAGADVSALLGDNLLRNAGGDGALVEGKIPLWAEADGGAWTRGSSGPNGLPFSLEGSAYFYPTASLDTELRQDIDVSAFAPVVETGAQSFAFKGYVRASESLPSDGSRVIVEYLNGAGTVLSAFDSGVITSASGWAEVSDLRIAPAGTRRVRVRLLSHEANSLAGGGLFDGLSLRLLSAATAQLGGSVSDDGLPAGSTLGAQWSVVSGPGPVLFGDSHAASTNAVFTQAGAYVLRLAASDSVLSSSDDVMVTVTPANLPPVVSAGADSTVVLSRPASLIGSVTDDGLPAGGVLTTTWAKIGGPGEVSFGDAHAAATTATFDAPGVYALRLTATDSEHTISDELTVTVEPANQSPVVSAGADQTGSLPAATSLSGSASDDGRPAGSTLGFTWSKTSGPGEVTFGDAHAAVTTASFSAPGTYVLKLSATDSELTGEDEVIVNAAATNQAPTVGAGTDQSVALPASSVSLNGSVADDGLPNGSPLTASWSVVSAAPVQSPTFFGDDFNDGSFDTSKWQEFQFSAVGAQLVERNGRLEFQPGIESGGGTFRSNGYADAREHVVTFKFGGYDLAQGQNARFRVRDDGAGTTIWAEISSNIPGFISFLADSFFDQKTRADGEPFPYDGTSPIWLRWRQTGQTYTWETSEDGDHWHARAANNLYRPATPAQFFKFEFNSPAGGPVIHLDDFAMTSPAWDAVAGPGEVTFSNPNQASTSAAFSGAGIYTLRLAASDSELTGADDVTVTVRPTNRAPSVSAGPARLIHVSEAAKLSGTVIDEGLPVEASVTQTWSVVSGPGEVTFADASAAETTAIFSSAGYYVLRLAASDSELTNSGDVTIKVVGSYEGLPGGVFISGHDADAHASCSCPQAFGAQHIVQRAIGYVTYNKPNPKILFVTDLRDPGGDQSDTRIGLRNSGFDAFDVADYGSGAAGVYDLRTVNFADYDVIFVASDLGGWLRQDELDVLNARADDLVAYVNGGGGIVAFAETGDRQIPPATYAGTTHDRFKFIPFIVSSEHFHQHETGIRITPAGRSLGLTDADVSANVSHNIFTTDGGMDVIDVDFEGQAVSLAMRGRRVTREGVGSNDAPIVSAGAGRTITLPNGVSLDGLVSDDGMPGGGPLNILWRKISGPGAVAFSAPNQASTSAAFGEPGAYVLRLSASDGQLSSSSDLGVTVNPTGQYVIVSAGPDQTIRLPKTASLQASVTDGRLATNEPLTLQWSKASGPGEVSFASPGALATTASFSAHGVYVLRFSAGDSGYAGSDEVTINVRPQPPTFGDDFDDSTNDPAKWYYGPGVAESEQQLHVDVPDAGSLAEFVSAAPVDMSADGAYVSIEIPDYADPSYSNNRIIFWRMQASEGNWFQWIYRSGSLEFYQNNQFLFRHPFGLHPRFWRMVHHTAGEYVGYETSDDGVNWSQWVGAASVPLDRLTFRLIVGAQGAGAAGTFKLDNITSNVPYALTNQPPTPVTGGPYRATVGVPLQLDGSGSSDPGDIITNFAWEFGDGATATGPTPTHTYASVGTYTVRLTVADPEGATGTTTTSVTVTPPNAPPAVEAGADQTITLPATASLNGSVSDDGLPFGGALTTMWSVASGPGAVTLTDAASLSTTASFAVPGTYVLTLAASDSELTSSDDVTVNVNAAPPNQPPTANAGEDQTVTPGLNLVRNAGGEELIVAGVMPGWTMVEGDGWAQAPAGTGQFYESFEGETYFHAGGAAHAELHQDIDVSAYAASVATGIQQFKFAAHVRSVVETPSDSARVVFEFRDGSNMNVLATVDSGEITTSEAWHLVEGTFPAPAGTSFVRVRLIGTKNSGATNDAYFDSVSVRAIANAGVKLAGIVSDDGLPTGGNATATWSVVSGPGAVAFADSHAASTAASFGTQGTYVLRLTASDTEQSAEDEVTVSVTAPNGAPSVSAGADQTITLPNNETALAGAISDEGLPQGKAVSTRWKKVAGPGAVTFANASAATTNVTFTDAGNYVLRLTADDADLSASDELIVSVKAAPVNKAPTVEAGPSQSISLPTQASLAGQATDDGLPTGASLTYAWSKLSGPGAVTFSSSSSLSTTAAFGAEGVYTLRLTVNDSELSSVDEVVVTVHAAGVNNAPVVSAGPDKEVRLPDAVALGGSASDDGRPSGGTLSSAWGVVSGPGAVTFANPSAASTTASFASAGTYVLRLTATDTELSASDDVTVDVLDPVTGDAPTVEILSPADGEEVTAPKAVIGTVSGGVWRVEHALLENETALVQGWRTFSSGSGAVTNGSLGTLDPTLLLNGVYAIRLVSTNSAGQTSATTSSVIVARQMKVGNFTVSFNDLSVPVAGIPIQVVRTYDSRNKRVGDFGTGWTLSLSSARVQKTVPVGANWYETESFASIRTYCLESTRPQIVTVTFGDGKVYKFQAAPAQRCQRFQPFSTVQMTFTPMAGTRGTLTPLNGGPVVVAGSVPGPVEFVDMNDPSGYYFNPTRFRLTTEDGTSFVLNQKSGVESVAIPSGETLAFTRDGITHSSGESVSFIRDTQGRISEIKDPAGRSRYYTYDANGDLESFKDAEGNQTHFFYGADHFMTSMEVRNADGTSVFRPINNEYVDGRLVRQLDADGHEIKYEHDLASRREVIRDRLGNATVYEYDERGNVLYVKDAEGNETRRTYDERDNTLTETTAEGVTTNVFDAADNLTQTTDAYGNVTRYTYNAMKRVTSVTDPLGRVAASEYHATNGNLLKTTDAEGNETRYGYEPLGSNLLSVTAMPNDDPSHPRVTSYTYDRVGRLKTETDAAGHVASYTYDASGNRKSQTTTRTKADGTQEELTTSFEYDRENRVVKTTYADGTFTTVTYNELGKQSAMKDQLGRETKYEYDAQGRLFRTVYTDGRKDETGYDLEGRRTSGTDRAGRTTAYKYDKVGRLVETQFADGGKITTTYDALGRVLTQTQWLSETEKQTTTYRYESEGRNRVVYVTDDLSHTTKQVFDEAGNLARLTDALGRTTRYEYDRVGRRVKIVYSDATFETTGYDGFGQVVSKTDQAGRTTRFEHDSLGRLVKVIDALGKETAYGYDELGNQTSQRDANLHTTRYEYDKFGRRTRRTLPEGMSEVYAYNTAGLLESRTDFNGKTTGYEYDNLNRLTKRTPDASLNQPSVSFTYTMTGRRETMADASGVTTYSYDTRDRLLVKATPQGTLAYTYDKLGSLKTMRSSNANGVSVDYAYDELSRLKDVTDNRLTDNKVTSYAYDGVGNLESYTYGNGVKSAYTYNTLNRLTNLSISKATSTINGYTYTLGAAGNRESVTEANGRSVSYSYDALYRLTGETVAGDTAGVNGAVSYSYDDVGNRLSRTSSLPGIGTQSFTYDKNDQLTSDTYDQNGNTKQSQGSAYNYDFENRLTSINGGSITYAYDGDGNRVSKTVGGVTTTYLVDTNNLTGYAQVVEESQGGTLTRTYTYGHDLISQRQFISGNWMVSYYGYDGHGSVRLLTDTSGAVTDTFTYDAFGSLIARTGSTPNEYLYAGERFDSETGMYHLRARYMRPETGRFWTMDSFEGSSFDPLSLHKYLYAGADPVNKIDPSGHLFDNVSLSAATAVSRTIAGMSVFRATVALGIVASVLLTTVFPPLPSTPRADSKGVNLDTGAVLDIIAEGSSSRDSILAFIGGVPMFMCQTALGEFQNIVSAKAGPRETQRANILRTRITPVLDDPSLRARRLTPTKKLQAEDIIVFGTGDTLGVITLTTDLNAVSASRAQGVSFRVKIFPDERLKGL